MAPTGEGDLMLQDFEAQPAISAESIVHSLKKKGYCVIGGDAGDGALAAVLQELRGMDDEGKFEQPPDEIAEGLLGAESATRFAFVEDKWDATPGVRDVDARMRTFGEQIGPWTSSALGFELRSRGRGFIVEVDVRAEGGEAPPALTADACYTWLSVFEAHRIMCLHFLGPDGGSLDMQPFDEVSGNHRVPIEPGTWVLLRADSLSHTFVPKGKGYVAGCFFFQNQYDYEHRRKLREFPRVPIAEKLDTWLLDTVRRLKETSASEEELEAVTSRAVQRMVNQMFHRGAQVSVRGQACRFPGYAENTECYRCLLFTGTDAAEQIPFKRWDNDIYYVNVDAEALTTQANEVGWSSLRDRYNCQHGSFIEGIEFFDNKFFGLSVMESRGMDPNQRMLLETMYETAFSAGLKKNKLMKAHIGVYTAGPGTMETEWSSVPKEAAEGGALASTSGSAAILSNRLSYNFGMNGPNFLLSLDGASSLAAMGLATDSLQRSKPQCDAAFALGIDAIMHPLGYSQFCWAGLMSMIGRCLTFDQTADGYMRGEGSAGLYMNPYMHEIDGEVVVDETLRSLGLASAVRTAHSGKVASLSAPSGAQDQELIAATLREAEISALDIDGVDAWGAGTVLSDAVEVMALGRSLRGRRPGPGESSEPPEMLGLGCVKTTFGNGKPLAGMYAVIKVLLSHEVGNVAPSNHLNQVNPHFALEDVPCFFATEHVPQRMNSAFTGVTAKGFGGSLAHAILWGAVDFDRVPQPVPVLHRKELVYWPGGGGELDDDAKPARHYAIAGSWSAAGGPVPMKAAGRGAFSADVVVGELGFEKFQIWLDGDPQKVLHPDIDDAAKDVPVLGPSRAAAAEGCWRLGGRVPPGLPSGDPADGALAVAGEASAEDWRPGDQYQVQVLTNGKYRTVTWNKIVTEGAVAPPSGRYFLAERLSEWSFLEMQEDAAQPGVYRAETQLLSRNSTFSIVRNEDWRQMLYPARRYAAEGSAADVLGPDGYGRGFEWVLQGEPGDVFAVELQRSGGVGGPPAFAVSWRRVRHEDLPQEEVRAAKQERFYAVGSWDGWIGRHRMTWDGECYVFEVTVRESCPEQFQILADGDWNRAWYPSQVGGAGGAVIGPGLGQELCWVIGMSEEEELGGRYIIRLHVQNGRPSQVAWARR